MRLMFVYWQVEDAGSGQTIHNYVEAGRRHGHEVMLYAPDDERSRIPCSLQIESADVAIFVLEWNMYLQPGELPKSARRMKTGLMGIGHLNLVRLASKVPRHRRVVIDDDGMYNDPVQVDGDYSHLDAEAGRRRLELYDSLSDKIYVPSLSPQRSNVGSFLFHGYNPALEVPLDFGAKEYGMYYVGSNWFRWRPLQRVLQAIEPIREHVGRIGLVGRDWAAMPPWVESPLREAAYYTDPAYLRKLEVEIMPSVRFDQVIAYMSKATFNPVIVRPVFKHFQLVNPRMFETPAANTIPLFDLAPAQVREIYGERAGELVLQGKATEQIRDVLRRPEYYAAIVRDIRHHLKEKHSYDVRLQELLEIVES